LTGSEPSAARLKLFNTDKTVNHAAFLPDLSQGTGENTLLHGEGLLASGKNQTVLGTFNDNKPDTLFEIGNGETSASRQNAVEVKRNHTIINTTVALNGTALVIGDLAVTRKVTSARTESSDLPETLITKSYVDGMIGGIGSGDVSGGSGEYIKSISQAGATVTPTTQSFEISISDSAPTTDNAPTSKAVSDFVKSQVAKLDVAEVGGTNTYIQRISETDGKILATAKSFSTAINKNSDDTTAPTAKAVYDYIESIRTGLETKMSTDIGSAVGSLGVTSSGQAGSYIKEIKQDNGKIEPTLQAFDNSINSTSTNDNAPTSKVVYDFVTATVNTNIANI
jgi:hypothetical protein